MIPVIIGGISTAIVAYAIKEVAEEENWLGLWDNNTSSSSTNNTEQAKTSEPRKKSEFFELEKFYDFKQTVLKTTLNECSNILKDIKNLKQYKIKNVKLKDNFPNDSKLYSSRVNHIASDLTRYLEKLNKILESKLKTISKNMEVSINYNSYSKDAKKAIKDAINISESIIDILNIKIVNKKNFATKSSRQLVEDSRKIIEDYIYKDNSKHKTNSTEINKHDDIIDIIY